MDWTKRSLIAGISCSVISFAFIALAKIGASRELVLAPIAIGIMAFVIVLLRDPDYWELRVAQFSFSVLIVAKGVFHLKLELENIISLPGALSKLIIGFGGDWLFTVILALLTVVFTILFRKNNLLSERVIVIPAEPLSNDQLEALKEVICNKGQVPRTRIVFEEPKSGSTLLPCKMPAKYAKRLENAFYLGHFQNTGVVHQDTYLTIVDIRPEIGNSKLRWIITQWLGISSWPPINEEEKTKFSMDWEDSPASARSLLNRALRVTCRSLCEYQISRNKNRFFFDLGSNNDLFSSLWFVFVFTLLLISILVLYKSGEPVYYVKLYMIITTYVLFSSYAFRSFFSGEDKRVYTTAALSLVEIRLILQGTPVDTTSMSRMAAVEERAFKDGYFSFTEKEYREAWAQVARELTVALEQRVVNAPWDTLLSKPVYERFNSEFLGELEAT